MSSLIEPPALTLLKKLPMKWIVGASAFVIILIMGGCYISGAINQAKQLGVAEEKESAAKLADISVTRLQSQLKDLREENARLIEKLSSQQAVIAKVMQSRNQKVDAKIADLQAPKPAIEVSRDLKDVGILSTVQNNDLLFSAKQAQEIVVIKLDRDRLADNLTDIKEQLRLEQEKTAKLQEDLIKAVDSLIQANKVTEDYKSALEAYKKIANPNILKRILNNGKYVLIGIGIGLGIAGVHPW